MAETGEYSFKLKIDNQQLNLDIEQAKKAFADLAKQAKKAGAVFDDIPNPFDSIGKSAPKVEAAKKQFDALGMSVSQLARETPALAMGVNTYIMAISNNLPVFADAVKKVREENAALAAQGKPTVSVLKQIGSALISWQTLLIAVVTTLAMNGDKVWAWVKGLFSAKDALDDVEEVSVIEQKEKEFEKLPTEDRYIALLDAIDTELKNPDISMEEIDMLLDKRKKIKDTIYKQLQG